MKSKNLKVTEEQLSKIVESLKDENNNLKEQSRLGAIGNAALKQMNIEPKNKVVDPKPGVYKTTVQITNDKKLKVTLPEGTFEYSSYKLLPSTKKALSRWCFCHSNFRIVVISPLLRLIDSTCAP